MLNPPSPNNWDALQMAIGNHIRSLDLDFLTIRPLQTLQSFAASCPDIHLPHLHAIYLHLYA